LAGPALLGIGRLCLLCIVDERELQLEIDLDANAA
jgi:hypothetical protein